MCFAYIGWAWPAIKSFFVNAFTLINNDYICMIYHSLNYYITIYD